MRAGFLMAARDARHEEAALLRLACKRALRAAIDGLQAQRGFRRRQRRALPGIGQHVHGVHEHQDNE